MYLLRWKIAVCSDIHRGRSPPQDAAPDRTQACPRSCGKRNRGSRSQAAADQAAGSDRLFRLSPRGRCPQAIGHFADLHAGHRRAERSGRVEAAGRRPQSDGCSRCQLSLQDACACRSRVAAGRHRNRSLRPVCRPDPGADGFSPDHPGARQGRTRTDQGYLEAVAQVRAEPGIERSIRRRRRRHLFRRQALQPDQGPGKLRTQGADGIRQGRRAVRNPLRSPSPTSAHSGW